ncbi:MAG: trehalose-6-phosphate synthase [Acidobacteria bacterium]|nr:trehalose-6-phosphate synthase [Acidobacteriota bacterium]
MPRMAQFILTLIVGLALLTWAASGVVQTTAREWFERDVSSRAQLVLVGASQSLANAWYGDPKDIEKQLTDLARDERVMGAAACDADLNPRSSTPGFPEEFSCWAVGSRVRAADPNEYDVGRFQEWSTIANLPTGRLHVSASPVTSQGQDLGFVILLHDLSYIERREAQARTFLLVAFGFLAVMALGVPMFVARWARYGWSAELRSMLRGGGKQKREFQPILSDVRELVGRMANDREDMPGQWTAERLKQTLNRHLHGEKVMIVANREPYIHQRTSDGKIEVQHPASGLVTALEPVMRACSGVWIAHGNGSADRETVDRNDHVRVPPGEESYHIRRVWLTEEEEKGYYYGFSNEGLWPLCHVAHTRPIFRTEDWRHYQVVNQRFADTVCSEVDSDDPIVLVQDYHFALAPAMIRKRLPSATVIMFWHIPWPNAERMGICPWRNELLDGLLGSSIVGYHTQFHCNNFLDSIDRYLETRIDREQTAVVMRGHRTLVRPYPIALEWPVHWVETADSPKECRAQVWRDLGLKPNALLGVGVDRLDYTKGVEERLLAVELLLERHPQFRGIFSFAQLAAPSRTKIERYQNLNQVVEDLAARINQRFGHDGYQPIILLRSHHEPPEVFRFYRAADVCYVSSLHDGMNLVAKEFVAARTDLKGVLVLSEFTGAARELTEALIVNPYDLEASSNALAAALTMPAEEQLDRMRSMRSLLGQFNVYRWAGKMLVDAARLRNQERVAGRLSTRPTLGSKG